MPQNRKFVNMTWSPAQYTKFEDERTRPVRDLVAQIPLLDARHAVDLGCGPGNSTQVLLARFPQAHVTGMDSSPQMIDAAKKRLPDVPFAVADIATWQPPQPQDVILSNATLQWLPDHAALMPRLIHMLAPGGCLAVQMPDNLDEPSHRLMREVAASGPWASKLTQAAIARAARQSADWYYRVLKPHAARGDVWITTYHHPLAGAAAIVEWFKSTGLKPYIDPLNAAERSDFLALYESEIAKAYPAQGDGTVLLPFPRLFFVAVR